MSDASKIQIWNQALGYIGTRTVASEQEQCEEARQCALYFDTARRHVLRDFAFPWAQQRQALAQRLLPDVFAADWRFAYAMPDNCLKLHCIGSLARHGSGHGYGFASRQRAAFRLVHGSDDTACILTDAPAAFADFTQDVQTPALWDATFSYLLARRLAALIIVPLLKNNSSKVQELEQLYRAAIPQAYESAAQEQKDKRVEDSWLAAR